MYTFTVRRLRIALTISVVVSSRDLDLRSYPERVNGKRRLNNSIVPVFS